MALNDILKLGVYTHNQSNQQYNIYVNGRNNELEWKNNINTLYIMYFY